MNNFVNRDYIKLREISEIKNSLYSVSQPHEYICNKRVAVVLHLYYLKLWNEFADYLKKIPITFDLYITLVEHDHNTKDLLDYKNKILSRYPNANVFIIPNVGLDIGGFAYVLKYFIENNVQYDYLLKIHSKQSLHSKNKRSGDIWRKELLNTLLGSPNIINSILNLLESDSDVGMLSSKIWKINPTADKIMGYGSNYLKIKELSEHFKLNTKIDDFDFIGGTMFWCNYNSIVKYFKYIDIDEFISMLETGAVNDNKTPQGSVTHAMERMFGLFIKSENKKVIGI